MNNTLLFTEQFKLERKLELQKLKNKKEEYQIFREELLQQLLECHLKLNQIKEKIRQFE